MALIMRYLEIITGYLFYVPKEIIFYFWGVQKNNYLCRYKNLINSNMKHVFFKTTVVVVITFLAASSAAKMNEHKADITGSVKDLSVKALPYMTMTTAEAV